MEVMMAARTTREAARQRVMAAVEAALDRVIPADESQPLRGRTFLEWEDQADAFDQAVTTTLLEERAALEDTAAVEARDLGRCPHCGSDRLYLQCSEPTDRTMRTLHGEVEVGHQSVRCRACGRSFSPSAS
ncbi:MAG: hypothetical protein ACLFV7_14115 [Phycisphaerae bacterium]